MPSHLNIPQHLVEAEFDRHTAECERLEDEIIKAAWAGDWVRVEELKAERSGLSEPPLYSDEEMNAWDKAEQDFHRLPVDLVRAKLGAAAEAIQATSLDPYLMEFARTALTDLARGGDGFCRRRSRGRPKTSEGAKAASDRAHFVVVLRLLGESKEAAVAGAADFFAVSTRTVERSVAQWHGGDGALWSLVMSPASPYASAAAASSAFVPRGSSGDRAERQTALLRQAAELLQSYHDAEESWFKLRTTRNPAE